MIYVNIFIWKPHIIRKITYIDHSFKNALSPVFSIMIRNLSRKQSFSGYPKNKLKEKSSVIRSQRQGFLHKYLDLLNRIFVRLQRLMQGIPGGPAHLYNCIVTGYLEPTYDYAVKEIKEKFSERSAIIEVGCGTGRLLSEINRKVKPKDVVGLDISHAMIGISKRNLTESGDYSKVNLIVADAHRMPIREGYFDLLVSTGTLHHIRKPEEFFRECSKILNKLGEVWIYEFSYDADCKDSSKRIGKPCMLLRILAALHGLPRSTFEKGYIREALNKSKSKSMINYDGVATKLILQKEK